MEKRASVKTVIFLFLAFAVFIAAVFGVMYFPTYVTISLFCAETVLMMLLMLTSKGTEQQSAPKEAGDNKSGEVSALKASNNKLTDDIERARTHITSLTKENEELRFEIRNLTERNNELTAKNAELMNVSAESSTPQSVELKTVLFDEKMLAVKEKVDFGKIIADTINSMKSFAQKADIRMEYVTSGDVSFNGNASLLTTMMKNIVDNSVKYMRRAGSLHITVSNVAGDLFIVCKDDGFGISKEELPFIFDLNFQGSNRVSGNGLGLTQARDIVNAYGGTIYAKSTQGAGMGVYIQLPSDNQA